MSASTKQLALCGVMTALGVVLLCLGGLVPVALYICPMLASMVLVVIRLECSPRHAWTCFAATAILGLLLGPDKEAASLYLFLGYYPLLKPRLDAIRPIALGWVAKIALAAAAITVMYALLLYVFALDGLAEEFATALRWVLIICIVLGAVIFVLFDLILGRISAAYRKRRKQ